MPFIDRILFDAGLFIGALLKDDPRHSEARAVVEQARRGKLSVCTTAGILGEVYGALTWEKAEPPHAPMEAAESIRLLVESPSAIQIIKEDMETILYSLDLAVQHKLTARRVHDARHAGTALVTGIQKVYTYDIKDWQPFEQNGLKIAGPDSTMRSLAQKFNHEN
jgi:predicted nucleic acid-binding protein